MGFEVSDFRTDNLDDWGSHVFDVTGTHMMESNTGSLDAAFLHKETRLGRLSVNRVDTSSGFRVGKSRRGSHFAFQFVVAGNVAIESGNNEVLTASAGDVFVVHPELTTHECWSEHCKQFIVRVSEDTIDDAVSEAFGSARSIMRFKHLSRDPGIALWLDRLLSTQSDAVEEDSLLANEQVAHHLSQSLLMMLLTGLEQTPQPGSRAGADLRMAPYYVKRVERYMQQNFPEDISIEDVVTVAGVSARTVYFGFRRWLNTTPMNYLRDLRLGHARKELRKGRTGSGVVSSAALSSGFSNFGQFSKLYRMRFGETPSATLVRARD